MMRLSAQQRTILGRALETYCAAADRGELAVPSAELAELAAIGRQLEHEAPPADVAGGYRGIGARRGKCLCRICRTIVEGQIRALLASLAAEQRLELIARINSDGEACAR